VATSPFSLVQDTCLAGTTTLAAGATCTTGVIFAPSLNGPYTGTLTISSPSLTTAASIPLNGVGGVPGSVQFAPIQLVFPQTGVNSYSSVQTVTLTNLDNVNGLGSFTVTAAAGFKIFSSTCPTTLAASASCTVGVEFAPTAPGLQSGSLVASGIPTNVTSSVLPTGSFMPLSGVGFDFSVVSQGVSTQTIANGQTADYTLSMALLNPTKTTGAVISFDCASTSLPPYSSCTFNSSSNIPVKGSATGSVVVAIATGLSTTTARRSASPTLPLLCALALLPLTFMRRRRVLLLVALLAILMGGVSSCTQSSVIGGGPLPGSGSSPGVTGSGTYKVLVNATSNNVVHQVTLTLTVD
jgi:hypothetical protein